MRLALGLVGLVSSSTAGAQPKPPIKVDVTPFRTIDPTDRTLGINGVDVSGRILVPPPHPDSADWPQGMVIRPPDVGDDGIFGRNRVLAFTFERPLAITNGVGIGIRALLEHLVPLGL